MANTGFDGSIKIDTRIDERGFNEGTKKIQSSARKAMDKLMPEVTKTGTRISAVLGKISDIGKSVAGAFRKLLLGALIFFALTAEKIFSGIRDTIQDAINLRGGEAKKKFDALKDSFVELKAAIGAAFLPLVEFALPYIQAAVDWLIRMLNVVSQVTAAFVGQKQALQVIPGSAAKLRKEMEKTKKASEGALAAFDQLNVLAKKQDTDTSDLPKVEAQMVPITDDILQKVQAIKDEIAAWWNDPLGKIQETWGKIKTWFKEHIIDPIAEWWKNSWLNVNIFQPLLEWFTPVWEAIKRTVAEAWTIITVGALQAWEVIKAAWGQLSPFFQNISDTLIDILHDRFVMVQEVFQNIILVMKGIIDFIRGVFTDDWQKAWTGITEIFSGIVGGWKAIIKAAVNTLIDIINGMLRAMVLGINAVASAINRMQFDIPDWVPVIGGQQFSLNIPTVTAPQIPRLATGAVIPPNSQFMAILGDQKSGTNIETPEDLLRQIFREELGSAEQTVNVPIVLTLDGEVVSKNQKRIQARRGKSLIASGTT